MAGNQVVAAYRDGRRVKGRTMDFLPTRGEFHVVESGGTCRRVEIAELKAVFFVRDLDREPLPAGPAAAASRRPACGKPIRVEFADGELLLGTTQGYGPERRAFFVAPADPEANAERCFVVVAATRAVRLL